MDDEAEAMARARRDVAEGRVGGVPVAALLEPPEADATQRPRGDVLDVVRRRRPPLRVTDTFVTHLQTLSPRDRRLVVDAAYAAARTPRHPGVHLAIEDDLCRVLVGHLVLRAEASAGDDPRPVTWLTVDKGDDQSERPSPTP